MPHTGQHPKCSPESPSRTPPLRQPKPCTQSPDTTSRWPGCGQQMEVGCWLGNVAQRRPWWPHTDHMLWVLVFGSADRKGQGSGKGWGAVRPQQPALHPVPALRSPRCSLSPSSGPALSWCLPWGWWPMGPGPCSCILGSHAFFIQEKGGSGKPAPHTAAELGFSPGPASGSFCPLAKDDC